MNGYVTRLKKKQPASAFAAMLALDALRWAFGAAISVGCTSDVYLYIYIGFLFEQQKQWHW